MQSRGSSARRNYVNTFLEAVEPRLHLTAATVTGSSGADEIRVTVSFSTIAVEVNGGPTSYPTVIYNSLLINSLGNNDKIYIDSNDGIPITINGGNGDDEIHFAASSGNLDNVPTAATIQSSSGSDTLVLHDENAFGQTYAVNAAKVTRGGFAGVTQVSLSSVRLISGEGADTFNVTNGVTTSLVLDARGGDDILNLGSTSGGSANVSFENAQDFAKVNSEPGSTLNLLNDAGLLLTTNQSNFEGNTTLGTGYIVERNSQVAGGLGYWRERLKNGQTSATPSLISTFAAGSAASDAIGYAYAQDLAFTSVSGVPINSGDLVMRYTLKGDANLDKTVNFDDLVSLAQNYEGSGFREWRQGDFNLTRNVNFDDLVPLAQNYNATATTVAAIVVSPSKKTSANRAKMIDL